MDILQREVRSLKKESGDNELVKSMGRKIHNLKTEVKELKDSKSKEPSSSEEVGSKLRSSCRFP